MSNPKARVYKSTGSWYQLRDAEGGEWAGRIRGKLKIDGDISSTNPIAVGDEVEYVVEDETARTATIQDVVARLNYIVRVSPHNRHQKHIVASNLDAALLMATLSEPRTSAGFIDRFFITAEAYHIPGILVINKADLLREKDRHHLARWQQVYSAAGYRVLAISALNEGDTEALKELLLHKTTLFSGHSGVGKSTLINTLVPALSLRTGTVSDWSGKGQHTTTFAEMFDLPGGGSIIDTPGVKEFGLIDLEREELSHYFPEMRARMQDCRFNNCLHINEPGCAVKAAVAAGGLAAERYESYLAILDSIDSKY